ncbi:pyridoxal-phosphate dependent enzyme [Thalassospira sp. CH_XMU1448-2]|uniref:pyridoxal-phosphate dependent enzyme n=1 Tax=Thalassospira sp. CH_XMU1448-2 TaxID=3107773 RepID=UPI00300BADD4
MSPKDTFEPTGAEIAQAFSLISSWPEYGESPLICAQGLAKELGVRTIWIKDESKRFGLGGVKALGAPYGLKKQLLQQGLEPGSAACNAFIAVAATDGNHGLAVVWAARKFNCRARIFVGQDVDPARMRRIVDCGGELVTINGTYDDAVLAAEEYARADHVLLITDTDYHGDLVVTRDIMAGYAVLGVECARQLRAFGADIDKFYLQCGVGGMAAGCAIGFWHESGTKPQVCSVEPETAACVKASIENGRPTRVPGKLLTRMVGLSCGYPSLPALRILEDVCFDSIAIDDACAKEAQDALMSGIGGDDPVDTWDTGISGLAGLWHVARDPELRRKHGLDADSRILVVNSEGRIPPEYL